MSKSRRYTVMELIIARKFISARHAGKHDLLDGVAEWIKAGRTRNRIAGRCYAMARAMKESK